LLQRTRTRHRVSVCCGTAAAAPPPAEVSWWRSLSAAAQVIGRR
jgi:hypothetical protein